MRTQETLYEKIKAARETCGGCNMGSFNRFPKYLEDAIKFSIGCGATDIQKKLEAMRKDSKTKDFDKQLELDNKLCDILNGELSYRGCDRDGNSWGQKGCPIPSEW